MELWDGFTQPHRTGRLHVWSGAEYRSRAWSDVTRESLNVAATLRGLGLRPGGRVAAVLTNSDAAVDVIFGTWLAGCSLVSLPVPVRGVDEAEYVSQLTCLLDRVEAELLLVAAEQEASLRRAVGGRSGGGVGERPRIESFESLHSGPRERIGSGVSSPPELDHPAFFQCSSGSTRLPKACALTPRAIARQLEMLAGMAGARPGSGDETVVSWLPLSHDMGLFGCLLYAWLFDFNLVLSNPERFVRTPRSWFRDLSDFGGTMTAGTDTALHLASRAQGSRILPKPLRLRTCVVGAERVERHTLEVALRTFAPSGLSPTSLSPAYGLAEATLAVTGSRWNQTPRWLTLNARDLADGRVTQTESDDPIAAHLVSTGSPCQGVNVTTGGAPHDAGLSEVRVRSPSLAQSYLGDPELTAQKFVDGELRTGDLGFLRDGELFIVGRADDMVCVAGRNVHTRDIEAAMAGLPLVRKGGVVLVDTITDHGSVVALLELAAAPGSLDDLARHAAEIAMRKASVVLKECVFLERGSLPKTPSGKIQRGRCRSMLLDSDLPMLGRVAL